MKRLIVKPLEKIKEKISFEKVINLVVEAEDIFQSLKGKAGEQKKEFVVNKLVQVIDIPFVPSFITKEAEKFIYGLVIDAVVYMFNKIRGKVPTSINEVN